MERIRLGENKIRGRRVKEIIGSDIRITAGDNTTHAVTPIEPIITGLYNEPVVIGWF